MVHSLEPYLFGDLFQREVRVLDQALGMCDSMALQECQRALRHLVARGPLGRNGAVAQRRALRFVAQIKVENSVSRTPQSLAIRGDFSSPSARMRSTRAATLDPSHCSTQAARCRPRARPPGATRNFASSVLTCDSARSPCVSAERIRNNSPHGWKRLPRHRNLALPVQEKDHPQVSVIVRRIGHPSLCWPPRWFQNRETGSSP